MVGAIPHRDIATYFSAADLFVVGSDHDGSNYSLIEALVCGVTPAVADIPTFGSLTADGAIGALRRPGDAVDGACAIVAAASRDLAAERGRVRAHFADAFSWAAIGRRALWRFTALSSRPAPHQN